MQDKIGVLDSGVGGVSVLRKAVRLLPNENFIFYGDNANAPYGPRSHEEIRELSAKAVDHLMRQNIKALVLACNTITAAYAAPLREIATIPIIGMEPAVKPASLVRSSGKVLALATKATLALEKFSNLMAHYGEGVIPVEGKGLVEIVENGLCDSPAADAALRLIFEPYFGDRIDAIVLGCTHYPFLRRRIEFYFPNVPIFDGREGTVRQLRRRLEETGSLTERKMPGTVEFQTSGGPEKLELMKKLFSAV